MAMVPLILDATTQTVGEWATPRKHFGRDIFVVRGETSPRVHYQGNMSFLADITGQGALTATILVEGTNGGAGTVLLGTITLSGDDLVSDGFVANGAPWEQVRARVTALSGTAATINVRMGV